MTWKLALALSLSAQMAHGACAVDAMVVFDASASMGEPGHEVPGRTKLEEAQDALTRIIPQVANLRRMGLVTYGPGSDDACAGVRVHFTPTPEAGPKILAEIGALSPAGLTPLTTAVARAADALDHRHAPGIIVLVTDGNESCGGTPCALGERLQAEAHDLTVHVIGFKVIRDFFAWNDPAQRPYLTGDIRARCLAEMSGGDVVTAETVDDLIAALQRTLGCPLLGGVTPETRKEAL